MQNLGKKELSKAYPPKARQGSADARRALAAKWTLSVHGTGGAPRILNHSTGGFLENPKVEGMMRSEPGLVVSSAGITPKTSTDS